MVTFPLWPCGPAAPAALPAPTHLDSGLLPHGAQVAAA